MRSAWISWQLASCNTTREGRGQRGTAASTHTDTHTISLSAEALETLETLQLTALQLRHPLPRETRRGKTGVCAPTMIDRLPKSETWVSLRPGAAWKAAAEMQ